MAHTDDDDVIYDGEDGSGPAVASTGLLATLGKLQDEAMAQSLRADDNALLMQYHLGRHDTYGHIIELMGGTANVTLQPEKTRRGFSIG